MKETYLFTRQQMKNQELVPSWITKEFATFEKLVSEPSFPCYFGKHGLIQDELRYSYIEKDNWAHLPDTMRSFLSLLKRDPSVRRGLFLFAEQGENETIEEFRKEFWDILQYLHKEDHKPWPEHIPEDPDHHLWTFCFDGEPIFAFGNAPAYVQRKTRNLGNALVIGFQPRLIFEGLEGTEPNGINSREAVRKRVEVWDQLPKHPDISHYGDETHHEWKQFFIGDDCEPIKSKCPFHHIQKNKSSIW
ncbi:YqcI/YcgG family protein [Alteribacter keqinensis]|uniref:YqcI/YcgG family protein n=1 Tax=Alteribacter keqinensis TaxID=2483800 RepID=A0A3M7TNE5_9BACI|nr:YqcI/YcgG family protein [Alteribacter keqinensis]RNA66135.1 YqcI/YcgG family protein [Alteribacter keqinensis]